MVWSQNSKIEARRALWEKGGGVRHRPSASSLLREIESGEGAPLQRASQSSGR